MKVWNILILRLMLFIHFIFPSINAFAFAVLPVTQRLNPRCHQHNCNNYRDTKRAATTTTNNNDNDKDALNISTREMTLEQKDFFMGYINQHHSDVLCDFVIAFTDLGALMRRKNSFSGGSMSIDGAELVQVTAKEFEVKVLVHERSKESLMKMVRIPWDADLHKDSLKRMYRLLPEKVPKTENYDPVDDPIRRMVRLLHIVKRPEVTGKLCQLGIQIGQRYVGILCFILSIIRSNLKKQYLFFSGKEPVSKKIFTSIMYPIIDQFENIFMTWRVKLHSNRLYYVRQEN